MRALCSRKIYKSHVGFDFSLKDIEFSVKSVYNDLWIFSPNRKDQKLCLQLNAEIISQLS
jgi:hypothetical protein